MPIYCKPTESYSYNCFEVNETASKKVEQILQFKNVSIQTIFLTICLPSVLTMNSYF